MILLGSSKEKTYIKIYESISKYILLGVYKNGDKLPSIRSLAAELGVNPATIQKAYELLLEDKVVVNKEKSGYYVSYENKINKYLYDVITKLKESGIKKEEILEYVEKIYGGE